MTNLLRKVKTELTHNPGSFCPGFFVPPLANLALAGNPFAGGPGLHARQFGVLDFSFLQIARAFFIGGFDMWWKILIGIAAYFLFLLGVWAMLWEAQGWKGFGYYKEKGEE